MLRPQCDWVKTLGADECLDYRSDTFADDLAKATEGYVDVYCTPAPSS
jgi:NADPH-dependent curcumin reductase CurA